MTLFFIAIITGSLTTPVVDGFSSSSLVFNEFMAIPASSETEAEGEWIELYNKSDGYVNISGWRIRNQSGSTFTCGTYLVPAHGYVLLGASGNTARNGGYTPDMVYSGFSIAGSGSLTLIDPRGNVVESISYDAGWPVIRGCSCERINPDWAVGSVSSWALSTSIFGDGDHGTPGARNSVYENSFASNTWAFIKAFVQ